MAAPISFISWNVVPAANFPGGIPQVENAVVDQKTWVALTSSYYVLPVFNIINGKMTVAPDVTSQLNASLDSPNALYNASQAIIVLGNEGRNENL
jgi:hypothetical protein